MRSRLSSLLTFLRTRYALRTIARAAWLALACLALGLLLDPLYPNASTLGALAASALLAAALLWALAPRSAPYPLARKLDTHLALHDGLTTALEVSARHAPPTRVSVALLDDATHTLDHLRTRIQRRPAVWPREWTAALGLGLLLAGLLLRTLLTAPPAARAFAPLPAPGDEPVGAPRVTPDIDLGPPPPQGDPNLDGLASALSDEAAGHGVAEALDRGDLGAAADALRELADQVGQLSQEGRQGLAEALRTGAADVRNQSPELAEALDRAAEALESGDDASAAAALQALADMFDQLAPGPEPTPGPGGTPAPGSTPNAGGDPSSPSAQSTPTAPPDQPGEARSNGTGSTNLGGDTPLDLNTNAGGATAPMPRGSNQELELPAQPADNSTPGFTPAHGAQDVWQAGADLLRYPWELKRVVEAYFTR